MKQDAFERALEIEAAGAKAGLNPMFGEWAHTFNFAPVPYGNGGAKRGEFRRMIQEDINTKWMFSANIQVDIVLYVDVQTTLETDQTADLDNYAKAILDGIKGQNGVMIDDTQVQSLSISWIDTTNEPHFTVSIKGSPDDFILKPQSFYEMPDGLWYPHGRMIWDDGKAVELGDRDHFTGLTILEIMNSSKRRVRAQMRKAGSSRLKAYQTSKYVSSSDRGFHRSRIHGDFPLHPIREWQADREEWKKDNPMTDFLLKGVRATFGLIVGALAGKGPGRN
ncbi:Endodeoxyribonuclease RusA [compost metagenome]